METAFEQVRREAREAGIGMKALEDERDQLRQQVEQFLSHVDEMELAETPTGLPYALRRCLYKLADQVRKELGE